MKSCPTRKEIGAALRAARQRAGLTQQQASECIGRKQQTIGHWETGDAQPDIGTLIRLCELYGSTPDGLLGIDRQDKQKEFFFTLKDAELIRRLRSLDKDARRAVEHIIWELAERKKGNAG